MFLDVLLLNLADLVDEYGEKKDYIVKQVAMPPMGLLYIGQVLKDAGYLVKIYDQIVTGATNADLLELIKKLDPKIVGFSVLIDNHWTMIDLFKKLKAWNPNVVTIAGNYLATFFPEQMMNELDIDYCVRGEGEHIFLSLVDHVLKNKKNISDIKGIVYRENDKLKSTPLPDHIQDLDALPIPDRKLIDFNYRLEGKSTGVLSSRGCPFKCKFCNFSTVMGKKWRSRSANNVFEEIQLLAEQGYQNILFADDNFTLNKKRIYQLSEEIRKNKLDYIRFSGDCRIDNTNLDLMKSLVAMNCKRIVFGIESGNQRILDYYQKQITIEMIKQSVKTAKKAGMDYILGSFILGAPDETFEEAKNTVVFANKLELSFIALQILSTIQISPLYDEIVAKGLYKPKEDDWKRMLSVPEICPTPVSLKSLQKLADEGFVRFFGKKYMIKLVLDSLRKNFYIDSFIQLMKNLRMGGI